MILRFCRLAYHWRNYGSAPYGTPHCGRTGFTRFRP